MHFSEVEHISSPGSGFFQGFDFVSFGVGDGSVGSGEGTYDEQGCNNEDFHLL